MKLKTLWPKEKLVIKSNFALAHNVFKSHLLLLLHNVSACGKGLGVFKLNDYLLVT